MPSAHTILANEKSLTKKLLCQLSIISIIIFVMSVRNTNRETVLTAHNASILGSSSVISRKKELSDLNKAANTKRIKNGNEDTSHLSLTFRNIFKIALSLLFID